MSDKLEVVINNILGVQLRMIEVYKVNKLYCKQLAMLEVIHFQHKLLYKTPNESTTTIPKPRGIPVHAQALSTFENHKRQSHQSAYDLENYI